MTQGVRVAVFGGSFDPPHVAHVLAVSYVLACHELERVVVVPVFEHAFDKDLAPFEHRYELARRAFAWLPGVEVSRIEERLPKPSYTLQTLETLAAENPHFGLRLVVGSDVLHERHNWRSFERIEAIAPLLVLGRAGFPHPDAPPALLPDVSSTRVRELLSSGSEDASRELASLLPRRVLAYIREHGLYR